MSLSWKTMSLLSQQITEALITACLLNIKSQFLIQERFYTRTAILLYMKYEKYFSYRRGRGYPAPGLLFSFKTKFNIKVWINQKKRILVTGGAGFIGANLCKKLLDAGYKVAAIDNLI